MADYAGQAYGDQGDSLIMKVTPQNLEAEQSLLGGALTSEQARTEIGGLEKTDFYDQANGLIYDADRKSVV